MILASGGPELAFYTVLLKLHTFTGGKMKQSMIYLVWFSASKVCPSFITRINFVYEVYSWIFSLSTTTQFKR